MGETLSELIHLIAHESDWERTDERIEALDQLVRVLKLFKIGSWKALLRVLLDV